ncbi:hypothetical protein PRIC1_004176 [Phytophthora ramorum]|uniref:Toll-like receptor 2 n=1 Tax=Phytophthora ramorum TaxID=164328 RepID=UPI00309F023A|nr:Toll-like receptor 2 [Phytophthora ramorum]KAH7507742.1 Toll-like receptor 2 [Phytophthora ramorum]
MSSSMRFLTLAALALAPSRAFFFHDPKIRGDAYSYKGDGDALDRPESLFQPDDTFTDVTLENWDLSDIGRLNLPHSIQKLSLVKCNLAAIPDEVRALENLQQLNLAENRLGALGGDFAASAALTRLNVSNNALDAYNASFPMLTALDLSANSLMTFPNAVFASPQLDSFRISGNGFEIAAMSTAQYDFFAGLSDFEAGFADVASCIAGSLVYLQGKGVCRLDIAAAEDPAIVMRDHGANKEEEAPTPMATVGVVIPDLPLPSNPTKKYIIAAIVVLVVIGIFAGVIALISLGVVGGIARAVYDYISSWRLKRHREGIHEDTPLFFDQAARSSYQKEMAAVDKLFPSNDPVLVTWRIDYDSVTLVKKIAQGAFGEVW